MAGKRAPPPRASSKTPSKPQAPPKPLAFAPRARAPRLQATIDAQKPPPPPPLPRSRRIPLIAAGLVGGGIAFYLAQIGYSIARPYVPTHPVPEEVSDRYDRTATSFDDYVGGTESTTGINRLRKKLVGQARGDVLEVSAGTGRNTSFYDWSKVRSLVLLDQSAPMLEVARKKWEGEKRDREERAKAMVGIRQKVGNVEFRAQSALDPIEGPPGAKKAANNEEEGKFDTVVQTMGLCSTSQPEKLLQRMGEVVKRDGRILLLEHGRGVYDWLNSWLDKSAPGHADAHGCWWNKDIGSIVEKSGLEVVQISRPWYHFGTTWWVELRKNHKASEVRGSTEGGAEKGQIGGPVQREGDDKKSSWWGGRRSS